MLKITAQFAVYPSQLSNHPRAFSAPRSFLYPGALERPGRDLYFCFSTSVLDSILDSFIGKGLQS